MYTEFSIKVKDESHPSFILILEIVSDDFGETRFSEGIGHNKDCCTNLCMHSQAKFLFPME